jgi:hypothetical protein
MVRQDIGQGMQSHAPLSASGTNHSPLGMQHQTGGLSLAYTHQQGHQAQQQTHSQQHDQHSQQQQHPFYGASSLGVQPQMMGGMVPQHSTYYPPPQQPQWNMNGGPESMQSGIPPHYDQQNLQPQHGFHQQRHVSNNAMDVSGM